VPTLALHGINGDSVQNYHLMDEEFTRGMGFRRELPARRTGIHMRKGISPEITSSLMRIQAGKIKMRVKPFEWYQFQDQQLQILYTDIRIQYTVLGREIRLSPVIQATWEARAVG
jgi:hypothetical protein